MKIVISIVITTLLLGALLLGGFNKVLHATNELDFCVSCHSMEVPYEEYKETVHFKNASGVQAVCADCHVPKDYGPKLWAKLMAAKDVYHEMLGTIDSEEKYNQQRWVMANRVWRKMAATDSRECRSCHDFSTMNLEEQDKMARKKHATAEAEGKTCIDCHRGIAHEEPDEPEEPEEPEDQDEPM